MARRDSWTRGAASTLATGTRRAEGSPETIPLGPSSPPWSASTSLLEPPRWFDAAPWSGSVGLSSPAAFPTLIIPPGFDWQLLERSLGRRETLDTGADTLAR